MLLGSSGGIEKISPAIVQGGRRSAVYHVGVTRVGGKVDAARTFVSMLLLCEEPHLRRAPFALTAIGQVAVELA